MPLFTPNRIAKTKHVTVNIDNYFYTISVKIIDTEVLFSSKLLVWQDGPSTIICSAIPMPGAFNLILTSAITTNVLPNIIVIDYIII